MSFETLNDNHLEMFNFHMDKLLREICKFLDEEIKGSCMTNESKEKAKQLIIQSKKQLNALTKETYNIKDTIPGYMDMQGPAVISEYIPPDKQEETLAIYSDPSLNSSVEYNSTPERVCPYINLPVSFIPNSNQSGFLYRKERTFFFEQQKKIFVSIQGDWLLIYNGKKDLKPNQMLDLTEYEAKPFSNTPKENKKPEETFIIVNVTNSKSYQFTALNHIDMIQWVNAINARNKLHIGKNISQNHIKETVVDDETYDIVRPPSETAIVMLSQPSETNKINGKHSTRPLPKIPSEDCIYNPVETIDEDESLETYEEPIPSSNFNKIITHNTYDLLQTDSSQTNETFLHKSFTPNKSKLFALMGRK